MAIRVYSPRPSRGAGRLALLLKAKRLREHSTYIPFKFDTVINWGSSQCPYRDHECRVLNKATAVAVAANKLKTFAMLSEAGVSVPSFASKKENVSWQGTTVVRHKLTGHSGEGIEIVEKGGELPQAPLYVKYIKKKDEYRIHVVGDKVTTIQRKGRRHEVPESEVNWKVRNHKNGFVFVRSDAKPPQSVLDESIRAIAALGLDFGAVDVIVNQGKAYVLEVNTAPGMEGSTIGEYAQAINDLINARKDT